MIGYLSSVVGNTKLVQQLGAGCFGVKKKKLASVIRHLSPQFEGEPAMLYR
jgi:hypothetical protein